MTREQHNKILTKEKIYALVKYPYNKYQVGDILECIYLNQGYLRILRHIGGPILTGDSYIIKNKVEIFDIEEYPEYLL